MPDRNWTCNKGQQSNIRSGEVFQLCSLSITQYFFRRSPNLMSYFNGTAIFIFTKIQLAAFGEGWVTVFCNITLLYWKYLKLLVVTIFASKLVTSSFEENHKLSC